MCFCKPKNNHSAIIYRFGCCIFLVLGLSLVMVYGNVGNFTDYTKYSNASICKLSTDAGTPRGEIMTLYEYLELHM